VNATIHRLASAGQAAPRAGGLAARFAPAAGGTAARGLIVALGAATMVLAGCSIPQRLVVRDSNSPEANALVTLRPALWARREGPARGFELGYQEFRAEGDHLLASGQTLSAGPQVINGPDVLAQRAKVMALHFGFADRFYFGRSFELDVSAGGMKFDVEYELRPQSGVTGTLPFARTFTLPYGSITPRWRFNSVLALEGRFGAAGLTDRAQHERFDAALALSPVPQLSLRLGYAWRRTQVGSWSDPIFDTIDLRIRARGPMAGLKLDF
jgi:hypothetical protein